jgi:hypothetical protein
MMMSEEEIEELRPKLRPIQRRKKWSDYDDCDIINDDQLPERIRKLLTRPKNENHQKIYPIADIVRYIDAHGFKIDSPEAQVIREKYGKKEEDIIESQSDSTQNIITSRSPSGSLQEPKVSFKDPSYVKVNMTIGKKVRVKIIAPLDEYESYRKKGKMPPLAVRVRAAKASGFPDSVLEKMILRDDKWKENMENMNKFLNGIFGSTPSKPSKPKPKSTREALESIIRKKTRENKSTSMD